MIKQEYYPYIMIAIIIILAYELDIIFFSKKQEIIKPKEIVRVEEKTAAEIKKIQLDENERFEDMFVRQLNSGNPIERKKALYSIDKYLDNPDIQAIFYKSFDDPDKTNRGIALDIIGKTDIPGKIEVLTNALKKEDDPVNLRKIKNILLNLGKKQPIDNALFWLVADSRYNTSNTAIDILLGVYQPVYGYPRALENSLYNPYTDLRKKVLDFIKDLPKGDLYIYRSKCEMLAVQDEDTDIKRISRIIVNRSSN